MLLAAMKTTETRIAFLAVLLYQQATVLITLNRAAPTGTLSIENGM